MIVKFEFDTSDYSQQIELNRLNSSLDMALFIFQLMRNTPVDEEGMVKWENIQDLYSQYDINLDKILE